MQKTRFILFVVLLTVLCRVSAQGLPTDGKLTIRPLLQQLGDQLLQGKTGSIVAINPANGEILCLATNTPNGSDVRQAIGKPQAPGSTFKTAQALTLLSEGVISPETTVECVDGVTGGNAYEIVANPVRMKSGSANARMLITQRNAATAIDAKLMNNEEMNNEEMYDLSGREVQTPAKGGVYIINSWVRGCGSFLFDCFR